MNKHKATLTVILLIFLLATLSSVLAIGTAPSFVVPLNILNATKMNLEVNDSFVVADIGAITIGDGPITYSLNSQTSADIDCQIAGSVLSCQLINRVPDAFTTLHINASNVYGYAHGYINVSAKDSNITHPPFYLLPLEFLNATKKHVSAPLTFTVIPHLNDIAVDADGDELTHSILEQTGGSIDCSIGVFESDTLSCTYYGPHHDAVSAVTVQSDDGYGGKVNDTVYVHIFDGNNPPHFLLPLSVFDTMKLNITTGTEFNVIPSVSSIVTDPNGDFVTVSIYNQTNPGIDCAIISDKLNCTFVSTAAMELTTVTLLAEDGFGGMAMDSFTVKVTRFNTAPYFLIPPQFFNASKKNVPYGFSFTVVADMATTVMDDEGDDVTIELYNQSNPAIECSLSDDLNCELVSMVKNALTTLTVKLSDAFGGMSYGEINVSLMNNSILELSSIETFPALNDSLEGGSTVEVLFDSSKFPLNASIGIYDANGTVVANYSYEELASLAALPFSFLVPTNVSEGNYSVVMVVSYNAQKITTALGWIQIESAPLPLFTPSSSGGGGGGGIPIGTKVGPDPIQIFNSQSSSSSSDNDESDEGDQSNQGESTSDSSNGVELESQEEPAGNFVDTSGEDDSNVLSGQATGADGQAGASWIWWILVIIAVLAILWWLLAGKAKKK